MLVFDSTKRIQATEALEHAYVAEFHDPRDEPVADALFDWSFTDIDTDVDSWKFLIYRVIMCSPNRALWGGGAGAKGGGAEGGGEGEA